jgi:hypothetical protein
MTEQNENNLPVADCENCESYVFQGGDAYVGDVLTAVETEHCDMNCWTGPYYDTRPKFCKWFQAKSESEKEEQS